MLLPRPSPLDTWFPLLFLDLRGIVDLMGIAPRGIVDLMGIAPRGIVDLMGIAPRGIVDLMGIAPRGIVDLTGIFPRGILALNSKADLRGIPDLRFAVVRGILDHWVLVGFLGGFLEPR